MCLLCALCALPASVCVSVCVCVLKIMVCEHKHCASGKRSPLYTNSLWPFACFTNKSPLSHSHCLSLSHTQLASTSARFAPQCHILLLLLLLLLLMLPAAEWVEKDVAVAAPLPLPTSAPSPVFGIANSPTARRIVESIQAHFNCLHFILLSALIIINFTATRHLLALRTSSSTASSATVDAIFAVFVFTALSLLVGVCVCVVVAAAIHFCERSKNAMLCKPKHSGRCQRTPLHPHPALWADWTRFFMKLKPRFLYTRNKNHVYTYCFSNVRRESSGKLSFAIVIDIKLLI